MRSVFISSTFRDMQSERDMMHTDVIPYLNATAEKYLDQLHFIDLRWGVNTGDLDSDESSMKVLNVCLDEIDRSQPYMLIFIGDRYGWIPDEKYIRTTVDNKKFPLEDSEKSVTALEIEYGLLSRMENAENCIICIRNPIDLNHMDLQSQLDYKCEGELQKNKLEALKKRLEKDFPNQIIYYDATWDATQNKLVGLEPLRVQLIHKFTTIFEAEWQKHLEISPQAFLQRSFFNKVKALSEVYIGHENLTRSICDAVASQDQALVFLYGAHGAGKTSLLCNVAKALSANQIQYTPYFVSAGTSMYQLLSQLIWNLEEKLEKTVHTTAETSSLLFLQKTFSQLVKEYETSSSEPLVFIIDDIHRLAINQFSGTAFLPDDFGHLIKFILSSDTTFNIPVIPKIQNRQSVFQIFGLTDKGHAEQVVQSLLKDQHKALDSNVLATLINKGDFTNPLYLSLLLHRLIIMDSDDLNSANNAEELNHQMINLITQSPNSLDIAYHLLTAAGDKITKTMSEPVLELLATAPHGLRETDLESICTRNNLPWSTVDFTRFMHYLKPFVHLSDAGFWDFNHPILKDKYFDSYEDENSLYIKYLLVYIKRLAPTDPLRLKSGLYFAFIKNDASLLKEILITSRKLPKNGLVQVHLLKDLIGSYGIEPLRIVISSIDLKKDMEIVTAFFCEMFYPVLDRTKEDQSFGLTLFRALVDHVEAKFGGNLSNTTLAGLYNRIGAIYAYKNNPMQMEYFHLAAKYTSMASEDQDTVQTFENRLIAQYKLATLQYNNNQFDAAYEILDQTLKELTETHYDTMSLKSTASAIVILASNCQIKLGNLPSAMLLAEIGIKKSLEVYRAYGDLESLILLTKALINLSEVHIANKSPVESLVQIYDEIISNTDEIYNQSGQIKWLRSSLFYRHNRLDLDFSEKIALDCIASYESLIEASSNSDELPHLYLIKFKLATFYYKNQRYKECYQTMKQAIELTEIYISTHQNIDSNKLMSIAEMNRQMGTFCYELNDIDSAIHYASRSVKLNAILFESSAEKTFEIVQSYALSLGCLAEDYAHAKDFLTSKDLFLKQLSLIEALYNHSHAAEEKDKLITCLKNLYIVHMNLNEEEEAWTYRNRAEQLMSK